MVSLVLHGVHISPEQLNKICLGTFGDKEATLDRFKVNYAKLPENVKGRLVLENDEVS